MSSRVLRKLQGEKDFPNNRGDEKNSDSESELEITTGEKKKRLNINRYDLLMQQSHSESEVKEDDDHETEAADAEAHAENGKDCIRRKKKKKKKKKTEFKPSGRSSEDNVDPSKEDQFEMLWMDEVTPSPDLKTIFASAPPKIDVLQVARRNLNPSNELKKKFGSKIVQSEQSKRRSRGQGYVKATWIISPKENWPPVIKSGLSMKFLGHLDSYCNIHFTYEHSPSYQQLQNKFLDAVNSLIPDNIVAIINTNPYHVDALIQLSDMCKMSEDLQMAAELNERALYALEYAFHPNFNVAAGNCRVDFRQQENRPLYVTLFKHLLYVGQRSCYRTALELCRLLLSLDPDGDPMGVLLCIDFYALRCSKYGWLVAAYEHWEALGRNLSQLPNFAYSVAMARFHLDPGHAADWMIQEALIMFPSVLVPLLDKCSVHADSSIVGDSFFTSRAQASESPALSQLVRLYVCRNWHVWKDPAVLDWLVANAAKVLQRVRARDPDVDQSEAKRKRRYQGTPLNVLRHIFLSDIKEVTATMSQQSSDSPILSFDPLPPLDAVNLYVRPQRPRMYEHSNAFTMFFRSLMPTFNPNEPAVNLDLEDFNIIDEAGAEVDGAAALRVDLSRSITSLLDAMRDLLSNIHIAEARNDGDVDEDSEDEEEEPGQ